MQLLRIRTIPFESNITIQNAKLTAPQIEPAKLTQHTTPLQIDTKTENIKVRMDSSDMRYSMGMKSPADAAREAPAMSQQTANEVTSEYVKQGKAMAQRGMTISQYMRNKVMEDAVVNTNIGVIPSAPVDISWEPASSKVNVKRSSAENDWQKSAQEMEFIPSSITVEVKQLASVEIEYLGGFRYVPPSSDPNYVEEK
ncbi:MAG: DUF6470 family protein [Clostridium sp.]|nr:DUF6470 family protein [Clostridium sp.]MCM1547795.1 DUF6470 family protein [Ruminococcus sp.]